jgi:hypothetical protein
MTDIARMFIGTWRLVRSISIGADGEKEYPFGPDAIGYIYYSDTGVMAVQISRRTRQASAGHSNLHCENLSYFGPHEIDVARGVVRHFVEGQLFQGDHPELLERSYHFDGDLLSLKPTDGTNREILWRRVSDRAR